MLQAPIAATGDGTLHTRLINGLVAAYGARTAGWRKDLTEFVGRWSGYGPGEFEELRIPRFVPDAYSLSVTTDENGIPEAEMTLWEVEVSNPISPAKMRDYVALWSDLDGSDIHINFNLRVMDKYGVERTVDLVSTYYGMTCNELAAAS